MLEYVVNLVNFILDRPLKERVKKLGESKGAEHLSLLCYRSIRRLCHGNILLQDCSKKFLFSLQRKDKKMLNILLVQIFK